VTYAEETVRSGDGHVGDKEQTSNGMLGMTCRTVTHTKKKKHKKREGN